MTYFRLTVLLLIFLVASVSFAEMVPWPWVNPAPEVTFRFKEEGDLLLVEYTVTVNNSPAIVDCHAMVDEDNRTVALHFSIIQNRDLYKRSQRQQTLEWRIPKLIADRGQYKFELHGSNIVATTEQLNALISADNEG